MPVRDYNFTTGPETETLPTASDPIESGDLVTLSYAQSNFSAKAPTVTGSYASPSAIIAGTGISFTGSALDNIWFIEGSGGAVTISSSDRIANGVFVGQRLKLVGCSETNTVTMTSATPGSNNLKMNGATWVGGLYSQIDLWWDGADWKEDGRSESQ
jgi:hypothetical protein